MVLIDYRQYCMHYRKPAFTCSSRREFIELGQTCCGTHFHDVLAGSIQMLEENHVGWRRLHVCIQPSSRRYTPASPHTLPRLPRHDLMATLDPIRVAPSGRLCSDGHRRATARQPARAGPRVSFSGRAALAGDC